MYQRTKQTSKLIDITVLIGEYPLHLVLSRETKVKELWEIVYSHQTLHQQYAPIGSKFIGLASKDGYEVLDYLLTCMTKSLSRVKTKTILKAIYSYGYCTQTIGLNSFEYLKCLGKGVAGSVYLARSKMTGKIFALKQIQKSYISDYTKFQSILREKKIMTQLKQSNHTVKFHSSFESIFHLNFLLEFYPGGQLFFHIRQRRLSQQQARLYFCELILCLEHIHRHKILYRDLKPQNILVDLSGHLCIADFGLSKCGFSTQSITDTICGSPQYMAPDLFQKSGYGYEIDFYTLGIILYEFIMGIPPFTGANLQQMKENLMNKQPDLSEISNPDIKSLIRKLLTKDPKNRLCNFSELKNAKWLKNMDWIMIQERQFRAPFALDLYHSYVHNQFAVLQKQVVELNAMSECEFQPLFQFFNYTRPSSKRLVLGDPNPYPSSSKTKKQKRKVTDSSIGESSQLSHYRSSKNSKESFSTHMNSKKKLGNLNNLSNLIIKNQIAIPTTITNRVSKDKLSSQASMKNLGLKSDRKQDQSKVKHTNRLKSKSKQNHHSLSKTKKQDPKKKTKLQNTKYFKIKLS